MPHFFRPLNGVWVLGENLCKVVFDTIIMKKQLSLESPQICDKLNFLSIKMPMHLSLIPLVLGLTQRPVQ